MKFGMVVPMLGHGAGIDAIDAVCAKAEDVGLDSLWVVDHILLPYQINAKYPYNLTGEWVIGTAPWWDAFSVLAYMAARTRRVRLGTGVIVLPYRHPVHTAKIVATIDQLSHGRVDFGLGVGWMEDEFRNLGLASFHHRGAMTDEHLRIFKEAWSPDPCSFEGKYYRFDNVSVTPKPFQRPHPPLWVGGNTEAALRRVVEHCDGWFAISLLPEEVAAGRQRLDALARAAGKRAADYPVAMLGGIRVTDDPRAREGLSLHERRQSIVGTVDQVIEDLRAYEAAGMGHLVGAVRRSDALLPGLEATLANMEFLMREIAPAVR